MVLNGPGVVDADLVSQNDLFGSFIDELQLGALVPRFRQLQLVQHSEFHYFTLR